MRRIRLSIVYQRSAARNVSDDDPGFRNDQYCYYYQTERWKFVFLLSINLAEVLGGIVMLIQYIIKVYFAMNIKYNYSQEHCGSTNNTYLISFQYTESSITLVNTLTSFGNVAEIMVVAWSICLMNYLAKRLKQIRSLPGVLNNRKFLSVTFIISGFIISSAVIHSFLILRRILILITLPIYFITFVQTIKRFKSTLFIRAVQHFTQYGSNKEELKEHKYFTYTSTLICIGLLCILVSMYLEYMPSIFVSVYLFRKCFFPFNIFSLNIPILNPGQLDVMVTVLKTTFLMQYIFCFTGIILVTGPFLLVTLYTWYKTVCESIRNKEKYRFPGHDLTECLINNNTASQLTEGKDYLILNGLVK